MRLIDADVLMEWLKGWREYHNLSPAYVRALIDEQPTINPMKWIPVTERLPDLWDERYLVSLAWGGVGVMEYKSTGFHNYGSFSPVPIKTVTAWMPLPMPWKGEEDEAD